MSILDKTGQLDTITEGWRALNLFTDRYWAIRLFSSYLNDDPPREQILFFYGDGGNGKSLLLRFLLKHLCKRLHGDDWTYIMTLPDVEFLDHIKEAQLVEPVPYAVIDFGMPPRGDDRPKESFSALLMLRRALGNKKLRFPLFDFACVWYLHSTRKLSQKELKSLFPAEEMDFITEIVDAITGTAWGALGKAVFNIFSKRSSQWFTLYMHQRNVDRSEVEEIQQMDPESELIDQLPRFFAEDLNRAMLLEGAPKRVALFFDTYEALSGQQLSFNRSRFQQEEWLRRLLTTLNLSGGIITVVAGRERPQWAEPTRFQIPETYIDSHLIGHLSQADAMLYLERAGIADPKMRRSLAIYAAVEPNQVHPLYLGLCADVVIAAAKRGAALIPEDFGALLGTAEKGAQLIDRLLKYVDDEIEAAVRALSVCRAFNWEIYSHLGNKLNFQSTKPAFDVLARFSFVWRDQRRGEGWYRIHELLRRLISESDSERTREADTVMEQYYRQRGESGDSAAVAEAIYHANRLDWERGVMEWASIFEEALNSGSYRLCSALLTVRDDMSIETDFYLGLVSRLEGDYFANLAHHETARQNYLEAIAAYEEVLRIYPDSAIVYNNKGLALLRLGELQAGLSQHEQAVESYARATADFDDTLKLTPDSVAIHNNKSLTLSRLGELQASLSQHEQAVESYAGAITASDDALRLAPDFVMAHNNKAIALLRLGELQADLSQHEQAVESFAGAIAACNDALRLAPDFVMAHNNKGTALLRLGELQAALSQHEQAVKTYTRAIAVFDDALKLAPDFVAVHSNKSLTLSRLGELLAELSRHEQAVESYTGAIAACDNALSLAPDLVAAHNNKGLALLRLGELQADLSQHEQAVESFAGAIAACNDALKLAPEYVVAHNNKGTALMRLGELQAALSQHEQAVQSYAGAIAVFGEALKLAPDFVMILNNKGTTLLRLGELQAALSQHEQAVKTYTRAIAVFDDALKLAPDFVMAHNNKGLALIGLGELQAALSQHEQAVESYAGAITASDDALRLAPDFVMAHNNKAIALLNLGELQASLSQHEQAIHTLRISLKEVSRCLEIAPADTSALALRDYVQNLLEELGDE